ncbi:hypothetical protein [Lysinibacillus sp. NPDC093692]|uniref:hypothetical protein n=1 Tax=Lysinibacillus sp. NPDC093692 TaxID=3390578 RepID=UPI003CFFCE26
MKVIKYQFVIKLHNIKIPDKLFKGKIIDQNMRISNSNDLFEKNLLNDTFLEGFGFSEAYSFKDSVYIYEIGDYNLLCDKFGYKIDNLDLIHFFLRKVQTFIGSLWLVKDNSVNCEMGFLQTYKRVPRDGIVTSNAIFSHNSTSDGEIKETIFSQSEIDSAIKYYEKYKIKHENFDNGIIKKFINPLYKGTDRIERAFYFLLNARSTTVLPNKVINYCSLLECLFTNDSSEITHKVAERFALYLGGSFEEKKRNYFLAKELYKIRSKAIHGQAVGTKTNDMKDILIEIDEKVREILVYSVDKNSNVEVFSMKNEEFDNWFLDLIFL